jgi:molybdopterin-guanine dinucleotide biosynthesis protein A
MGRDKALLRWGETDLLGHALARLRAVTGEVRILCGPDPRYLDRGVPALTDLVPEGGPLAGILTGLASCADRPGLFLAVDLPAVPVPLLAALVERAVACDAVVPVSLRGPEPLCAVYGPACLGPIRRRLSEGDLMVRAFWADVRLKHVGPDELAAFGDPGELFRNLNAPTDLGDDGRREP